MLKKNDEILLEIEDYGYDGEGVGRTDGMPVFVPFAARGDKVRVKIVKTASSYMFGRMEELLESSPEREQAPCPVYGKCGGCAVMHLSYENQLKFKRERVADCMRKIGRMDVEVLPTLASDKQFGYRNKVQLPIGVNDEGKPTAGFYAQRSHRIVENTHCLLQQPGMDEIIEAFLNWIKENAIPVYDETTGKGLVRHLFIRRAETTGQTAVMPVVNGGGVQEADKLCEAMKKLGVTTLVLNINREKSNVVLGDKTKVLYGDGVITDELCGNKFEISPMSFYQINRAQAEKLYSLAMETAKISKEDTVYDLYCGAGTITLCAASYAKKVYGIEIVPQAVEDAKKNALINNVENVEFFCGDVAKTAQQLNETDSPDVVILDPPRKGCDNDMLSLLLELAPQRIAYISCNPATLARDMAYLCENGYTPGAVQPVDMFPQTSHVETLVLMSKM